MNPISALIASVGLTSSRAFVPAFVAAVMLRLGADHQAVKDASYALLGTSHVASWFTSDWCLLVLGALATLEVAANRSHDARALLTELDHYVKPVMGVVTMLGLLSSTDAQFIQQVAPAAAQQAGLFTPLLATMAAAGTFIVASARNAAHQLFHDADSENATGLHGILAWAEDLASALGMFFFIFFPVAMAVLIGMGIGLILLLQKRARAREEAAKVACSTCATPMYRSALACPTCRTANASPTTVNWLGVATLKPAVAADQPFDLVAHRRCPSCATRLTRRAIPVECPACHTWALSDPVFVAEYDTRISSRFIPTLVITAAMGLVPVVGLVAGVLFYRMYLVAPYRALLPRGSALVLRWGLRLLFFVLALVHLFPVIGAVAGPVMAAISFGAYRAKFLSLAAADRIEAGPVHAIPARQSDPAEGSPALATV